MIDQATVEKIKNTADIVEVVGDYVHLVRRGANYMGLCPFHNERTPSFSVNKQRNFCYCFSCKKGGSPVNFIMEKEGLSYHEALLHLAKKYGIEVVERVLTDEDRAKQSAREAMFVANEWSMRKMESDLVETDEGRDIGLQYFTHRGVTDEAIKAFHLGYALDRNSLTEEARKAGFNLDILKSLGLIGTSQQGREYDRFRGRVIFPILNTAGKVIAFGGRDLKGGLAKYINSPESELYKKSNELYGIYQAKSSIVSEDKCFLVEGYMDVIGMWQSGMKNVVASSGTALTDGQIAMIHRFTDNITLIYDGDNAGIKASLRGIDMLLSHRLNVKVMLLPDGDDPDSFARKHTPEEFKAYVKEHETDIIRYKAQVMLDAVKRDPQNRIKAVNSVVQSIAQIADQVSRDVYVQECADILGIPDNTIAKAVGNARAAIVEEMKKERTKKAYSDNKPIAAGVSSDDSRNADILSAESVSEQQTIDSSAANNAADIANKISLKQPTQNVDYHTLPLYPLEREVMKYCVRYAFIPFCTFDEDPKTGEKLLNEDGSPRFVTQNVLEFVRDELAVSNMQFTIPIFEKLLVCINDLKAGFDEYIAKKMADVESEIAEIRQNEYNRISTSGLSMQEISRDEEAMEKKFEEMRALSIREYSKDYPCRILGSHEDDEIRKMVLELSFDKHHLSNIYLKDGNTETEEDKLNHLLLRSIDEWKNQLINLKIRELMEQLQRISGQGLQNEEQQLQLQLSNLLSIRAQMAKQIGERILFTPQ